MGTCSVNAERIVEILVESYPSVRCELIAASPWELLVAVILSARTADERVNQVMPVLQEKLVDVYAYASTPLADLEHALSRLPLFRQKARSIKEAAQAIVRHHRGTVPASEDALRRLPGVGAKTAAVVLGNAFGTPTIAVDVHVNRLALRTGLSAGSSSSDIEADLARQIPPQHWVDFCHRCIRLGRDCCRPRRPWCSKCPLAGQCRQVDVSDAR